MSTRPEGMRESLINAGKPDDDATCQAASSPTRAQGIAAGGYCDAVRGRSANTCQQHLCGFHRGVTSRHGRSSPALLKKDLFRR